MFPWHEDEGSDCVIARVCAREPWRRDVAWPDGFAGGVAHRLDTSTSGALWIANDLDELARMRAAFASGALHKTYRMRASKDVPWDANQIDRPIAHARRHRGRMVVQRGADTPHRGAWYPARTSFRRLDGRLWEVVIETGVTHQIRVHAAFVGLPIAGDRAYGGGPTPADALPGVEFLLHHVGLVGPGLATDQVPLPDWARSTLTGA